MRKFVWITILLVGAVVSTRAQQSVVVTDLPRRESAVPLTNWDREHMLDSLDQERLPCIVTTGLIFNANMSNFVISHSRNAMSSYMRIGVEAGGFVDFCIDKHFGIQAQCLISAEQNRFSIAAEHADYGLWQVGMDIPFLFMGRFGNLREGFLQLGGGLFTHFQFANNVGKPVVYTGNVQDLEREQQRNELQQNYQDLLKLHNNHFGVCGMIGYEFPVGVQVNASYRISLSDICTYYVSGKQSLDEKQLALAQAAIYPQKVSLGIAYRFRQTGVKKQKKTK